MTAGAADVIFATAFKGCVFFTAGMGFAGWGLGALFVDMFFGVGAGGGFLVAGGADKVSVWPALIR